MIWYRACVFFLTLSLREVVLVGLNPIQNLLGRPVPFVPLAFVCFMRRWFGTLSSAGMSIARAEVQGGAPRPRQAGVESSRMHQPIVLSTERCSLFSFLR